MRLSDFIEQANQADSGGPIVGLMERAAGDLGFDKFAYCEPGRYDREAVGSFPALVHNLPAAWENRYVARNYRDIDPVLLLAPDIEGPFLWEALNDSYGLSPAQLELMREAGEAGLKDGVAVPLHGPRGRLRLVSFAAGGGHPDPVAELPKLDVLAAQFHSSYSAVNGTKKKKRNNGGLLSSRECECLQWIASGKSSWDIGMILNISENTVNFHVKNALQKLDANTRTLAVVKAIRYGLISL